MDLQDARKWLTVSAPQGADPVALWNSSLRIHPREVSRVLTHGIPGVSVLVTVEFVRGSIGSMDWGHEPDGQSPHPCTNLFAVIETFLTRQPTVLRFIKRAPIVIGHSKTVLNFDLGAVFGEDAGIAAPFQREGLGRRAALNRLELWKALGFRRALGMMGKDVGGYVWALLGYRLQPGNERSLGSFITRRLGSTEIMAAITPAMRETINQILAAPGPDLPFLIARLDQRVGSETLGSQLLRYSRWPGEFDLAEESLSWERARSYGVRS